MRFGILITAMLITAFTAATAVAELEIFFPREGETTAVSDVHVVGRSDSGDDAVISINGVEYNKRMIPFFSDNETRSFMLMSILKLSQGENTIRVIQGDSEKILKINKVASPQVIGDWTEELSSFHESPEREEICSRCHRFQNINDCVNCHRDKFMGQWVHTPVKEGKCFTCHTKENSLKPVEPFADTCLNCHKDFNKEKKNAEIVHMPTAEGYCTICHSPHKSTQKTHLRNPVEELCAQCHFADDPEYGYHAQSYIRFHPVDNVTIPGTDNELDCADCHLTHYSDFEGLLDVATNNREDFCNKCHDEESTPYLLEFLLEQHKGDGE
ncbi:cytochrome c3 family protein [Limisalsivibrio acetivorans]|uniref:cytochrome c3 family protein n=1 Tax=Limisalsivibrio acetivorans TaxID=1304888 RepID=UPI0003B5803F|nr:cytochrome c3 family protein [Limisalsivibrio acetivorans]